MRGVALMRGRRAQLREPQTSKSGEQSSNLSSDSTRWASLGERIPLSITKAALSHIIIIVVFFLMTYCMPATLPCALHSSRWTICTTARGSRYNYHPRFACGMGVRVTQLGLLARSDLVSGRARSLASEAVLTPPAPVTLQSR